MRFFKGKTIKKSRLHSNSKKRKVLFLIAILLLFLFTGGFFAVKFLNIKQTNLELRDVSCVEKDELEPQINLRGKNLFFINSLELEKKFQAKYGCIDKVKFKKSFPNTLGIDVLGKRGVLILNVYQKSIMPDLSLVNEEASPSSAAAELKFNPEVESTNSSFLVDSEGKVFGQASLSDSLPTVNYVISNLNLGDSLPKYKIDNIIKVLEYLKKIDVAVKNSVVEDNLFFIGSEEQILFALDKDPYRQSASLQLILQQAKMDSKQVEKIDLRFSKPVVVYVQKKK